VVYVLGVGVLPAQFNAILHAQRLPPDWVAAVLDGRGVIAGRTLRAEKFVGHPATPALVAAIRGEGEGAAQLETLEGWLTSTFFTRSAVSGWSIAIGVPRVAAQTEWTRPLALLALGVVVLFAIGLSLAWLIGGQIARSVAALIAPATGLGSGAVVPPLRLMVKEAAAVGWAIERAAQLLRERAAALAVRAAELREAHRRARFGTWHWDLESNAVDTSDSIPEIYGRPVPDFPAQRGTVLTEASWQKVAEAAQTALDTGVGYDLELEVNHGAGHTIWVRAQCEVVRNATGRATGLRGTIQDISTARQKEEALRDSERGAHAAAQQAEAERRRLDAVLEAVPVAIVVADAGGAMLQSNALHRSLWGAGEPAPESIQDYGAWQGWWADEGAHHGRRLQAQDWAMSRALSGVEVHRQLVEIETFHTPPERRIVMVSGAPVRDGEGHIIGGVIAQMDVTDRVRAERALQQADRRKDEFLATLAHELRNPLAPIGAAAEILARGGADAERVRRTGAIIARQVRHLTALVEDLLDVSRVTRGLVTLDKVRLDANRVVGDAVEQVRPLIETRGHRLDIATAAAPAPILGDQKRLVQVVTNLLNNAAKFTPEGGVIRLAVSQDDHFVCLTVSDNGIGMTPELVASAFDLFAQGERATDRSRTGLGIGLALVKSLVSMHGGTVRAESAGPGQGSRFVVQLPRAAEPAAGAVPQSTANGIARAAAPLTVLVVDDNVDAAQMLGMFIETLGYEVLIEYGSQAALERARAVRPDVCLLDIGLPEMDGNELARRLRAMPETAGATLVAVTGYGQRHERERSFAAGFDEHMIKPVEMERLAALLAKVRAKPH